MNKAYSAGLNNFKWWMDWQGECVAIVASGPSTKKINVGALRDRMHVVAIKTNIDLCPWAEVLYGCDEAWWNDRKGMPQFKGLKIAQARNVCSKYPDIKRLDVDVKTDNLLTDTPMVVGSGGNSGFQIFNLAVQFGATGIVLIGFDMNAGQDVHWYGRNKWPGANNPQESNYVKWRKSFETAVPRLKALGIDVVNASDISTIKCFPQMGIEAAMRRWGLC